MTEYMVSKFTGDRLGLGMIDPQIYTNPKDVARALHDHQETLNKRIALNKMLPEGERKGLMGMEVQAIDADGRVRAVTPAERSLFKNAMTELAEDAAHNARRFGVVGKTVGAVAAGTLAMAGGANASEVGKEAMNAAIPGVGTVAMSDKPASQGTLCEAFGQATGAVAGVAAGVAVTATTGVGAVAAIPVGLATEAAATPAATWACNKVANVFKF